MHQFGRLNTGYNTMKKFVKLSLVSAPLLVISYVAVSQLEIITMESRGNTKAYKSHNWSYAAEPDLWIPKNSTIAVVGCEKIKTDIHIQVKRNGHVYNVSDGSYLLKREKASFFQLLTDPNASYSCKGLFLNEQIAVMSGNA